MTLRSLSFSARHLYERTYIFVSLTFVHLHECALAIIIASQLLRSLISTSCISHPRTEKKRKKNIIASITSRVFHKSRLEWEWNDRLNSLLPGICTTICALVRAALSPSLSSHTRRFYLPEGERAARFRRYHFPRKCDISSRRVSPGREPNTFNFTAVETLKVFRSGLLRLQGTHVTHPRRDPPISIRNLVKLKTSPTRIYIRRTS